MLRPYQKKIVDKMMFAMTLPGNDIVSLAQGGGKTHIIAEFAFRLGKPLLILVPSKELLEQDLEKLSATVGKDDIGVFSASMNSKEVKKYTLATIQSAHKHPELFSHYDVAIIDEADLLNPKNLTGMYNSFFKAIGVKKVFGLTGTPFRQDHYYVRFGWNKQLVKTVTTTKMIVRYPKPFFWARMLAIVNTDYLTKNGFLSPIEYHDMSMVKHSQLKTNVSKSDFDLDDFENQIRNEYGGIVRFIQDLDHKAKLVFCASITQAEELQVLIPNSVVVTSKTTKKDREKAVEGFKNGSVPILLNVGIYTVGFDYPELDCIVLLRPTRSLRLHCQILGRVARIALGKSVGHVYDIVNNVRTLGELSDIRIEKVDTKWNVVSPTFTEGFHNQPLYEYVLER